MEKKKIIWVALTTTNFIYIFLAFSFLKEEGRQVDTNLSLMFLGIGIFLFLLSFILERILKKTDTSPNQLNSAIVGMAINESCGLLGVVTMLIAKNEIFSLILFAISTTGFILRFPKSSRSKSKLET